MVKVIDRRKQAMDGYSKRSVGQIKNIAVHYSATASGSTSAFENHWKNVRKWVTGGYHEVVLLNGDVELNYDPTVISNGVYGHNTNTYISVMLAHLNQMINSLNHCVVVLSVLRVPMVLKIVILKAIESLAVNLHLVRK